MSSEFTGEDRSAGITDVNNGGIENEENSSEQKLPHAVAQAVSEAIRRKFLLRKEELSITEESLGDITYRKLGDNDAHKKIDNLLCGRVELKISDLIIMCEGLGINPDRIFTVAYDGALNTHADTKQFEHTKEESIVHSTRRQNVVTNNKRIVWLISPDKSSKYNLSIMEPDISTKQ
jgi:hypothetical protein